MTNWRYKESLTFNKYVESILEDFRTATFDRVLDTEWEGAREKVDQWRIKPGGFVADPTMTTTKPTNTPGCTGNDVRDRMVQST